MSENGGGEEIQAAPAEARRRHADLSLDITEADHRYYVLDSPTISDIDYDTKMRELRALEEQHPDLLPLLGAQVRLVRHEAAIGEGPKQIIEARQLGRIVRPHQHAWIG